jgi:lysozyme family protein
MDHPLAAFAREYSALLAAMVIDPAREKECEERAEVIIDRGRTQDWARVTSATGVPFLWGGASFERECSSNYSDSPAQGDPWNRVSVNVPRGLGPYASWADAAIPAYRIDGLDKVGLGKWQWTTACYYGEKFNGFGPRNHGKHTGYLWAGTNIYNGGKYVSDGVWDPNAKDMQLGMVPLMVTMTRLDPSLAFADAFPGRTTATTTTTTSTPIPPPQPVPVGHGGSPNGSGLLPDTTWLQQRLNALGASPQLIVDGNYGRQTERAVSMFQTAHGPR